MSIKNLLLSSLGLFVILSSEMAFSKESKYFTISPYKSKNQNPISIIRGSDRALPSSVDLMENQTEVKDQDQRGTCAYFSTTALVESEIKRITEVELNISEEFLIRYSKGVLGFDKNDDGSDEINNLQAFRKGGFALERNVPYHPDYFAPGLPCDGIEKESAKAVKAGCYSHGAPDRAMLANTIAIPGIKTKVISETSGTIVTELKKVLAKGYSAIVAVPVNFNGWDDSGNAYYTEDLKKDCDATPDKCGEHSVVLVGYDDNADAIYDGKKVKGAFYFKNSWGRDWGQHGYGQFPYKMIAAWGYGAIYAVLGDDFELPTDAGEVNVPKMQSIRYANSADDTGNYVTTFNGSLKDAPNSMIYVSTFVANESEELLSLNGANVRTAFYQKGSDASIVKIKNAQMTFEQSVWDEVMNVLNPTALRVSSYIFTDTEKWKMLSRKFLPL